MSSVLVRDTFEVSELNAIERQDCRVEDVTVLSGTVWIVLSCLKTDAFFVYKLHEVHAFLRTMRGNKS